MPGIPDRWLPYTAMGQAIAGTKFICFKVPLKKALNKNLDKADRFSPDILLEKFPDLGLVIDLTNTKRYYNSLEFLSRGVYYKKIFCPGRVVPPLSLLSQFIKYVDDFLNKTQDKLIGVHCTHGVNRTGYFVCSYMIRRLGMSPQDAISEFEKARGHRIEREFYVEELKNGSTKELPPPLDEDEEEMTGNRLDVPSPRVRERHRKRNYGNGQLGHLPEQPHSSDRLIRSDRGFQQSHDRNWRQRSGGYPQYHDPHGKPSSSGCKRLHQDHISPLSGAYDDNQPSYSRYGKRHTYVKNYRPHQSSLDGAYGQNPVRNTKYNWRRRDDSQNRNSDKS